MSIGPFTINGKLYFTIDHASGVIGPLISQTTLGYWVRKGRTPWDHELDIARQPVLKHGHKKTTTSRNVRYLISEHDTLVLKTLLKDFRQNPHRPLRFTKAEKSDLKAATPRYTSLQLDPT